MPFLRRVPFSKKLCPRAFTRKVVSNYFFPCYCFFMCRPFSLAVVWLKPSLTRNVKIIVTVVVIIVSYVLWIMLMKSLKGIGQYYGQYQQLLNDLK